ncbi:hypothetical protein A0J61_10224, partial [Choanephora cucurbitarum]
CDPTFFDALYENYQTTITSATKPEQ